MSNKYNKKNKYFLNDELENKGWFSDETGVYIPFLIGFYYLKIAKKNNGKFTYTFYEIKEDDNGNNNFKVLSRVIPSGSPITELNNKRDSELHKLAIGSGIDVGELEDGFSRAELQEIGVDLLNADCLGALKTSSSDYEEFEDKEEEKKEIYTTFDNYPADIKEEALKIIESGNIINSLQKIVGILHEGDKKAGKILLLCLTTLFIENAGSVHEATKGSTGKGKTDLTKKIIKLVPKQYVEEIRDSSPKYIYYACEDGSYNEKYNIFFYDDIVLNDTMITIIKTLADNLQVKKTLKTVKEQTTLIFEIPGKCLVIMSFAKEITDEELNNRLFYNNPQEDEVHGNKTKEKIRDNENIGLNFEEPYIKRLYTIANAVMQYIIDKEIRAYNPYITLLGLSDKSYREVSFAVNLIKGNLFYNINNRKEIDGVHIASIEDVESITAIWKSNSLMQQHKIDAKQIELIKSLPEYSEKLFKEHKSYYEEDSDSLNNTFKAVAKELGFAQNTIKTWVFGRKDRDSNKPTMIDQDLIKAEKLNPEINNSPYVLYKGDKENLEELLKSSENDITTVTLDGSNVFNSINMKKKVIYDFLSTTTNNKYLYNEELLDDFLDDGPVESYEDICNLLEESTKYLKENVTIDNFTPETFDELIESLSNQSTGDSTLITSEISLLDERIVKTLSLNERDIGISSEIKIGELLDEIHSDLLETQFDSDNFKKSYSEYSNSFLEKFLNIFNIPNLGSKTIC